MKKSLPLLSLIVLGVFLLSTSRLCAEKKWLWYVHSKSLTAGSPGTFDVTIAVKANTATWVGRIGNFDLEGEMNIIRLYDFDEGFDPFLLTDHLTANYSMNVDNPAGDREWNLECSFYDPEGTGDIVTEEGIQVATIRFYVRIAGSGDAGITLGVEEYQETFWDDNSTLVDSVEYDTLGGQSLPVQMSSLTALASPGLGIKIGWETQSEVNCAGFHVWKSLEETQGYLRITPSLIPGYGNSSEWHSYSYTDSDVEDDVLYWYQVEEISMTGENAFFGPISAVGVDPVPEVLTLSQNYPNPFNSETWFEYQLPEAGEVRIGVFDLLGKEVQAIVQGKQSEGTHSGFWDGKNSKGDDVPSGLYFLFLRAGQNTQVKRMTVLR